MIKNIFMPERSGNYYLFGSRSVGITIGAGAINAVQVRAQGSKRIIEKTISVPIDSTTSIDYQERIVQALRTLFTQLDRVDHVVTTLPSLYVVFKKVHIPFVDREKIAQVIAFEVEPLLPFPLSQAQLDFVIMSVAADGTSAEVLVAAAQKEAVHAHKALFEKVGIIPTQITVDILSLYSLITTIPAYTAHQGNVVVLIIGSNTTCVALIREGVLALIRTLPKGITHIAKSLSGELSLAPDAALEELMRFGVDQAHDGKKHEVVRKAIGSFFDEIAFTLQTFSPEQSALELVIILGAGTQINGLLPLASELLHAPCQPFSIQSMVDANAVQLKTGETLAPEYSIPLSAALRLDTMLHFNLAPEGVDATTTNLFIKQVSVAVVLLCCLLGILGTHYYTQRRAFSKKIVAAEKETIDTLKDQFKDIDSTELKDVTEDAQEEIDREEARWFAFSSAARSSVLTVLLELKSKIDKEALGFVIERLFITQESVVLKARVRDYEALKVFEKSLHSSPKLNDFVDQNDPSFELKITLPSPHKEEE